MAIKMLMTNNKSINRNSILQIVACPLSCRSQLNRRKLFIFSEKTRSILFPFNIGNKLLPVLEE